MTLVSIKKGRMIMAYSSFSAFTDSSHGHIQMTCRMAAGQQKKRLSSSNFHEQYRGKKKKNLDSSEYILNLRSHIDLEWDGNKKRAVAKREQVGISWRNMSSFVDSASPPQSGVADVISLLPEFFSLVNLTEVLSYEVWVTCLSEAERRLLMQFLPNGTGAEQVVHSLLKGDNHHFGNPFIKWSSSLCSGDLHPDVLLQKDKQFRVNKRAYYSEINMYHKSMLEDLTKWKERWLSSNDVEKLLSEGLWKRTQRNLAISSEKDKFPGISKKETSNRICIRNGDNDRYLSYIKISKAQHELLKKIKLSGDGIQSKSLNRVLGDIKSIPVHPYDRFGEEERKRLNEHWLQVANKDLPEAFEVFRSRSLQREQWRKAIKQELAEKNVATVDRDVETDNPGSSFQEVAYDGDYTHQPADVEDESDENSLHNSSDSHMLEGSSVNSIEKPSPLINQEVEETLKSADDFSPPSQSIIQNQNDNIMDPQGSVSSTKDIWQTTTFSDSYHSTPDNDGYKSACDLSFSQPQLIMDHSTQLIDLGHIMESRSEQHLTSVFDVDNGASAFSPFLNQGRSDTLPSFSRGPTMLPSYTHEHMNGVKQSRLPFFMTNNRLPESSQLSMQFQQQHQLLQQRELRDKNLATHQMLMKDVYPASRYPSQGHFPSVEQHNFSAVQLPVNGGGTGSFNCFPGENQVYNSWSGVNSSIIGHSVGHGCNTDGSLYSVLNNKLPTCPSYSSTGTEHYIPSRNFVGGGTPNANNIYGYAHQLDKSTINDTAAPPPLNTAAWVNIPHQSSSLYDSFSRSFIRPWNS